MGVDSGYGSGAVRSASSSASRANATRAAANRKKGAARNARARTIANRTAAAMPSTVRDKYDPTITANIGNAISYVLDGPNGGMINGQRVLQSGVSPWKAMAMYAARVARAIPEGANGAALMQVAKRAPRGAVAQRLQTAVARGSVTEARNIMSDTRLGFPTGYSSGMFPDHITTLFRPSEIQSVYRAMSKIAGQRALPNAGRILRDVSRKGFK